MIWKHKFHKDSNTNMIDKFKGVQKYLNGQYIYQLFNWKGDKPLFLKIELGRGSN